MSYFDFTDAFKGIGDDLADYATTRNYLKAFDQQQAGLKATQAGQRQPLVASIDTGAAPQSSQDPQTAQGSSLPTIAGMQGQPASSAIGDLLRQTNAAHKLPDGYLTKVAGIESGWKADAFNKGSGASGPFQFVASTAKQYGLTDPTDWAQSADAAGRLAADNAAVLRQGLGREPTGGQLYLAHQQGAQGALALLSNPTAAAGSVLPASRIAANGGDPRAPAGVFAAKWTSKFDGGQPVQTASSDPTFAPPPGYVPTRQPDEKPAPPSSSPYGTLGPNPFGQPASAAIPASGVNGDESGPVPVAQSRPLDALAPPPRLAAPQAGDAASPPVRASVFDGLSQPPAAALGLAGTQPSATSAPAQQAITAATGGSINAFPPLAFQETASQQDFPTVTMSRGRAGPSDRQAPVPTSGGQLTADASSAPYGSQPISIGGRMLTRQQAEDTDGIDHTDYDAAAQKAGLTPTPFVDSATAQSSASVPAVGAGSVSPTAAAAAPSFGAASVDERPQTFPPDVIRTLLSNAGTRDLGLQLWKQSSTGQNFGFLKVGDDILRTNDAKGTAELVYQGQTQAGTTVIPTNQAIAQGIVSPGFVGVVTRDHNGDFKILSPSSSADKGDGTHVITPGGALVDGKGTPLYTNDAGGMDAATVDSLATRVYLGDTTALTGLGRGAQGAENIAKIQKRAGELAAENQGRAKLVAPEGDILTNRADQLGEQAGARASGTLNARLDTYAKEASGAMDLGINASRNVPRTTWAPLNRAIQSVQNGSGDPDLAAFVAANNAIINTYAKAINPNGVPTVSDKVHASEVLSTAQSPEAYEATIRQLQREINVAHNAARGARAAERSGTAADDIPETSAASSAPGSTSTSVLGRIVAPLRRAFSSPAAPAPAAAPPTPQGPSPVNGSRPPSQAAGARVSIPAGPAGVALWNSLPSGTKVVDPNGVPRLKP